MPVRPPRSSRSRCQHSRHNELHAVLGPPVVMSHLVSTMHLVEAHAGPRLKSRARTALVDVHWHLVAPSDQRTGAASCMSDPATGLGIW